MQEISTLAPSSPWGHVSQLSGDHSSELAAYSQINRQISKLPIEKSLVGNKHGKSLNVLNFRNLIMLKYLHLQTTIRESDTIFTPYHPMKRTVGSTSNYWRVEDQLSFNNHQYDAYSALMLASANGRLEKVKAICSDHRDVKEIVNELGGWNNSSALMLAAKAGHRDIVRFLLSVGADVLAVNDKSNTALHLAAEEGREDIVSDLIFAGSDMCSQNVEGQSPLLLTVKSGHMGVLLLLTSQCGRIPASKHDPVEVRNKFERTALLLAAELGRDEMVAHLIAQRSPELLKQTTSRGINALMLACGQNSPGHQRVVKLLLEYPHVIDVNFISAWKWTALTWASTGGALPVVRLLLDMGADPEVVTLQGDTALSKAIENGHCSIVALLLEYNVLYNATDCLRSSLSLGHLEIALEFYQRVAAHEHLSMEILFPQYSERTKVLLKLSSSGEDALQFLSKLAGEHDFFFDVFVHCVSSSSSPKAFLAKQLPIVFHGLQASTRGTDADLLSKTVALLVAVQQASTWHPWEATDLQAYTRSLEKVLHNILAHPIFRSEHVVNLCLCVEDYGQASREIFRDEQVQRSRVLSSRTMEAVLRHNIKPFFNNSYLSSYILNIFWAGTRLCPDNDRNSRSHLRELLVRLSGGPISKESTPFTGLRSDYLHARFRPSAMFAAEGISRMAFLASTFRSAYMYHSRQQANPESETVLITMLVATALYDLGKPLSHVWLRPQVYAAMEHFYGDTWHMLDLLALLCIAAWLVWSWVGDPQQAYALLAVACMPMSVGLLRYLSINERIGKLTIMIFAMAENLVPFAAVYIVILAGFTLALTALFSHGHSSTAVPTFITPVRTLLSLFSSSLNNYESSFLDTFEANPSLAAWGVLVQLSFVIWFSVVMLNVVIAQMSATHHRVDEKAKEEWRFVNTKFLMEFALIDERHPFVMLPPPLNLLTAALAPAQFAWLTYGPRRPDGSVWSLAGTVADMVMGSTMAVLAPWYELLAFLAAYADPRSPRPIRFREMVVVVTLFPFVLWPMHTAYLMLRISFAATFVVTPSRAPDPAGRFSSKVAAAAAAKHPDQQELRHAGTNSVHGRIIYPLATYHTPILTPQAMAKANRLSIKLLRINNLKLAHSASNPVVYFQLADMELRSQPSVYGGISPIWLREMVEFPLASDLYKERLELIVEVRDRDALTGHETYLGSNVHAPVPIASWIANGQFAGSIMLQDRLGEVVVEVTVHVPDFLKIYEDGETASSSIAPHAKSNPLHLFAVLRHQIKEKRNELTRNSWLFAADGEHEHGKVSDQLELHVREARLQATQKARRGMLHGLFLFTSAEKASMFKVIAE